MQMKKVTMESLELGQNASSKVYLLFGDMQKLLGITRNAGQRLIKLLSIRFEVALVHIPLQPSLLREIYESKSLLNRSPKEYHIALL